MKRKQIIEILSNGLQDGNIEMHHINIEQLAEKLALPLDVPSDEEITIPEYCENRNEAREFIEGAKWMRDEIIKRNK